jgi:glycosyltransferase involved in cell wall biosynthesis
MKDHVLECIQSIHKQTLLPKEILLVLDNDPNLLHFFKPLVPSDVKVLSSNGFGLSIARNTGVKNAKGEIIAFIDDDAVADKEWLRNIFNSYSEPTVAGVGGLVLPMWLDQKSFDWFPEELNWVIGCSYRGQSSQQEAIRNPLGCNMSYRQTVFEKVGYFRQDIGRLGKVLLDGEEPEFSIRVHQTIPESKIMNVPSAVVLHKVNPKRMKLTYIWKRSFYQGYSKALINTLFTNLSLDLDVERKYLNYLLNTSIKSRIKRFYNIKNLAQLTLLCSSLLLVMVGFAIGKIRKAVG